MHEYKQRQEAVKRYQAKEKIANIAKALGKGRKWVYLWIDRYEAEQKTLRDRIAVLDAEKQNLDLLMSPQGIEAQVSRMPYADKNKAIQQVKESLDARFRAVTLELEQFQVRNNELSAVLKSFRDYGAETEKHLQGLEESVKKLVPAEEPKQQ